MAAPTGMMPTLDRRLGMIEAGATYVPAPMASPLIRNVFLLRGPVTEEAVRAALATMRRRHPLLDARITETPRGLFFVRDHNVTADPIAFHGSDPLPDPDLVYRKTGTITFAESDLLYHVDFILDARTNNHVLISSFHHAIADGLAAAGFGHELSRLIVSHAQGRAIPSKESPSIPPCIEALTIKKESALDFLSLLSRHLFAGIGYRAPAHEASPSSLRDIDARSVFLLLSKDQTAQLHEYLSKNGLGINSFLGSTLLYSEFRHAREHARHPSRKRAFSTPVSCRKDISDPVYKDGPLLLDCTAPMLLHVTIEEDDDIKTTSEKLRDAMRDSRKATSDLSSLWYPHRIMKFLVQGTMGAKRFKRGVGATFAGTFGSSTKDGFHIALLGGDLAMREGMSSVYSVAHVMDGSLQVSFSYTNPYLSDESARAIVALFAEALPVEGEVLLAHGPFELARKRGLVANQNVA